MRRFMKKYWFSYIVEAIIAILLLIINVKVFFVYAFIAILVTLDRKTDYLRALIRVFQVANETKIMAIQRKVGVTDADLKEMTYETEEKLSEEQLESLQKDLKAIYS